MNNLFAIFDPSSWFSCPLNWVSSLGAIFLLPPIFWASHSQSNTSFFMLTKKVSGEFKAVLNPLSAPGLLLLPLSLFVIVIINNSLGLVPYVFTSSSHLMFTVSLAMPLWLGHMALGSFMTLNLMLAHLVPLGTPVPLLPLMVLIELVSSLIRPFTLSVRLAANMIAGHLLLSLLGGQAPSISLTALSLLFCGLVLLMLLECAVSMIQAYVFSVLSTLYVNEVNHVRISAS